MGSTFKAQIQSTPQKWFFFDKKKSLFDISKTCCLKRFEIIKTCQKHSFCSEFSELFKKNINLGVTLLQTPQNQVWVTLRWFGIGLINHASKLDGTTVLYLQEVVFRSSGVCFRKKVIETLLKTAEMIRKHEQTWSTVNPHLKEVCPLISKLDFFFEKKSPALNGRTSEMRRS